MGNMDTAIVDHLPPSSAADPAMEIVRQLIAAIDEHGREDEASVSTDDPVESNRHSDRMDALSDRIEFLERAASYRQARSVDAARLHVLLFLSEFRDFASHAPSEHRAYFKTKEAMAERFALSISRFLDTLSPTPRVDLDRRYYGTADHLAEEIV